MKNQNSPFRPTQHEIDDVTKRSRRDALKGGLAGGLAGALVGSKYKAKLIGAGLGATAGDLIGRRVGRHAGADDVVKSRKALLQNNALSDLRAEVSELLARKAARDGMAFETVDGAAAAKPIRPDQTKIVRRPSVSGEMSETGNGRSSEAEFFELREALTERYGWAITSALSDDELSDENCKRLRDQALGRQAKAGGPHASTQNDPEFARAFLGPNAKAMTDREVLCHFQAARRNSLIEFSGSEPMNFALINRTRNPEGQFADDNAISSQAVKRAYHPRDRKTGIEEGAAAVGAGALGAAGLLALRKRRLRLPSGVPKLPPRTIDVDATSFAMGHPGKYPIKRRALRGKKPPTHVRPVSIGKAKKHSLAFLIHDDAFPLVPQPGQKLAPGMRQRAKPARTRKDVIARLQGITALASNFGVGSAVAETLIDAAGIGGVTSPKKKKLVLDRDGNPINPQFLKDAGITSTSSFASAIERLHQFGIASAVAQGAGRYAPEVGAIAGGDILAESLHDRLVDRAQKRKKLLRQRGGIQATPGTGTSPGTLTTMSAVLGVMHEFDYGKERVARAKRRGEAIGATAAGGVAGALGGAFHDQGSPVRVRDLRPGDQVYRRKGPLGVYQHTGVVDETGERIVHRTKGASIARSVTPDTFMRGGRGPLRRESHSNDLPRAQAARNASRAAGQRQGKYCVTGENCQTGSTRIASKGAPHSRQVRKVIGGAAVGALAGSTIDRFIRGRKEKGK